jgi:hypothetical protein
MIDRPEIGQPPRDKPEIRPPTPDRLGTPEIEDPVESPLEPLDSPLDDPVEAPSIPAPVQPAEPDATR